MGPDVSQMYVEVAFWLIWITHCMHRNTIYWNVSLASSLSLRVSLIAVTQSFGYLPASCTTFADAILWLSWLTILMLCFILCAYCILLTPLQLIYSPMELYLQHVKEPKVLTAFDILHDPRPSWKVELIAIHGLGSDPSKSWSRVDPTSNTRIWWLKDILAMEPNLHGLKILQVNHQTQWDANVSPIAFEDHARSILKHVESAHGNSGRPIIFLAHSFGGLLLEKALLLAKLNSSPIANDTKGVIFLGVPHRGTRAAILGSLLACTAKWRGSSTVLLEFMAPGTTAIKQLEEDFHSSFVLRRPQLKQKLPYICDFFEQRPEKFKAFTLAPTVSRESASSFHGELVMLDADHRGMNKFVSSTDPNYQRVLEQITTAFNYASSTSAFEKTVEPTHNLPYGRDKKFVGRHEIIQSIHAKLFMSTEHKRIALVGLGGMGKSQIAVEYTYHLRELSPETWVFWVRAGSVIKFDVSYCEIAQVVGLLTADELKSCLDVPSLVLKWLKDNRNGRWIIIIDGADDSKLFSRDGSEAGEQLLAYLPRVDHGSVLITSRSRSAALRIIGAIDDHDDITIINAMADSEAEELLRTKLPDHLRQDSSITELTILLENIPLAITQAAACIERMLTWSVSDYVERFNTGIVTHKIFQDPRRESDASNAILLTWQISFEQIKEISPSAATLLSLMSMFDPSDIPDHLIFNGSVPARITPATTGDLISAENPVLQKYLRSEQVGSSDQSKNDLHIDDWANTSYLRMKTLFDEDIAHLADFALISIHTNGRTYNMHALVQLATIEWLANESADDLQYFREQAVARISMAFPVSYGNNFVREWSHLYRHAEKVLDYNVTGRTSALHRAEVLYCMGRYMEEKLQYELAVENLTQSLNIRRSFFVGDNLCIAYNLYFLGRIMTLQMRYTEAEDFLQRALNSFSISMGFSRSLKDTITHQLAASLIHQNKFDAALSLLETASKSVDQQRVIAEVLFKRGDYQEALLRYRGVVLALETDAIADAIDIPSLIFCKSRIAIALQHLGDFDGGINTSRDALHLSQASLGENHVISVTQLYYLAGILGTKDDTLGERKALLEDGLRRCQLNFGPENSVFYLITAMLITIYVEERQISKILEFLEPLSAWEEPSRDWLQLAYWTTMCQYGLALQLGKRHADALTIWERIVARYQVKYGTESQEFILASMQLAATLMWLDRFTEAVQRLEIVHAGADSRRGKPIHDTLVKMMDSANERHQFDFLMQEESMLGTIIYWNQLVAKFLS